MISSQDKIPDYLPEKKPNLVILGTMASINARDIKDSHKDTEAFFYNDKRNRFWDIIQLVFEPHKAPACFSSRSDKQDFLNRHQIAMANIVREIHVPKNELKNPSDEVIFRARAKHKVKFKNVSPSFRSILKSTPLFFTCSRNKNIEVLVQDYFKQNKVLPLPEVHFLLSPTRCNPIERSLGWKIRMAQAGLQTPTVRIPDQYYDSKKPANSP